MSKINNECFVRNVAQMCRWRCLAGHLVGIMNMELVGTNNAFEAMQSSKFIVVDHWRVKIKDVSCHLCNQGS